MKVEDLRIGNILQDREGRICVVEEINGAPRFMGGQTFKAPAKKGPITALPHSPIPLTEEWINKFQGTEGIPSSYDGGSIKRPEFVHQLQNLYYVLTGKELNYNEIL